MFLTMLKAKIHRATVTGAEVDYAGSIEVDTSLLKAAGIRVNEQVHVYNVTNGQRFVTYAIPGSEGSGVICVNGAAALLVNPGDLVIIASYALVPEHECDGFCSDLVFVDEKNAITETKRSLSEY